MLYKRRRERNREKKSHRNYIKKNYRYKIDNKYQKAKIKNLEQSLEFQKYNVKEKKKIKKKKATKVIYIYEVCFFLKKGSFFFCKVIVVYKNEN